MLIRLIFVIGCASSYEIVDYRIPLWCPQLASATDPDAELSYYFKKLNIDYPKDNVVSITTSNTFVIWHDDFQFMKLPLEEEHACELSKTPAENGTFEYHDSVSDFGKVACYNQCLAENEEYYRWFLTGKMQPLVWQNHLIDVNIGAPRNFSDEKKIAECTRLGEKKYRCDCFYTNCHVMVSREFELLFNKILREVREMNQTISREELDKKYGIPMKLIGFLLLYHLSPEDLFTYLVWWYDADYYSEERW